MCCSAQVCSFQHLSLGGFFICCLVRVQVRQAAEQQVPGFRASTEHSPVRYKVFHLEPHGEAGTESLLVWELGTQKACLSGSWEQEAGEAGTSTGGESGKCSEVFTWRRRMLRWVVGKSVEAGEAGMEGRKEAFFGAHKEVKGRSEVCSEVCTPETLTSVWVVCGSVCGGRCRDW